MRALYNNLNAQVSSKNSICILSVTETKREITDNYFLNFNKKFIICALLLLNERIFLVGGLWMKKINNCNCNNFF